MAVRSSHREESAASGLIAFLVAGAIILAAAGVVFIQIRGSDSGSVAGNQADERRADALLGSILSTSGSGWEDPDTLERLGLSNGQALDYAKVRTLQGAQLVATGNGILDYEEARLALGLEGDAQFHLRVQPLLEFEEGIATIDGLETAYIAHWEGPVETSIGLLDVPVWESVVQERLNLLQSEVAERERAQLLAMNLDYDDKIQLLPDEPDVSIVLALLGEVPLLDYLGVGLVEGDVFPDEKQYLDAHLPSGLAGYDVLVVGSEVRHSSLTSEPVKNTIRDWVLAGGTLVVFGSEQQSTQWLQPIFSVGTKNINGAPTAPDASHPILNQPHELLWNEYATYGQGWDFPETGANANIDDFEHVIVAGGLDTLAVSRPGSYGDGMIVLATYSPGSIEIALGVDEAGKFLQNTLVLSAYRDVHLEYGPMIPTDGSVASATSTTTLFHPQLGQIPMRAELLYWHGSVAGL